MLRCFLGRLLGLWLIGVSIPFHQLGKLADMVEVIADFRMVLVNEATGAFLLFSPSIADNDFAAVWDTEQFFIVRVDKSDALLGSADMPVKPFLHIAVTVEVIIAPCRVASEQESVF